MRAFLIALSIVALMSCSNQKKPLDEAKTGPQIEAELTSFSIDQEFAQFVFTLGIANSGDQEATVYAVVYGKNESYVPPRRNAWPFPGVLFNLAGTNRGQLSSYDIRKDWDSRPEDSKGMKISVKPSISDTLVGALPINETSPHGAWQGQRLDPNSMYNEVSLWIFSEAGELLLEKDYSLK
jgi:hypothetical protein